MKNLRNIRFKNNLTMRELGDAIGVHYSLISYWEKGKKYPRKHNLEKLCSLLETTEEELNKEVN